MADDALWSLHSLALGPFLDATIQAWLAAEPLPFDPAARARAERRCQEALLLIQRGETAEARRILERAEALNPQARSPLVHQYLANLAILANDLYTAVHAQKEALRLEPGNRLYRDNLQALLLRPLRP
jgi:tetratricopeptide (TPR) repeat protein